MGERPLDRAIPRRRPAGSCGRGRSSGRRSTPPRRARGAGRSKGDALRRPRPAHGRTSGCRGRPRANRPPPPPARARSHRLGTGHRSRSVGPLGGSPPQPFTRSRYSPDRVSTLMRSPSSTNRGTWTTAPVSSFAGFIAPVLVSPFAPGSVWMIARATEAGSSTAMGTPWCIAICASPDSARYRGASPMTSPGTCTWSYVSLSMNTYSPPSAYRYCIDLRSTIASPTFTPALKVFSTTAPVLTLRSFERTKAPPLPGFTCWNSTTWNKVPSRSRVIPFFRSFVDTLTRGPSQLDPVARGDPDDHASILANLHHVLDPDPADPGEVDPGFDRDHGAFGKLVLLGRSEPRLLVDLEADPVTQAVDEVVPVPRLRDDGPRRGIHLDAGYTRSNHVDRSLLRLADDVVHLLELCRGLTERDRAGHVGVIALDERTEIELDHVALLEHTMPGLVMGLGRVLTDSHDRIER